jgi:hypothetical protein
MSSVLIKRDLRQVSKIIYENNNVDDWTKIILVYNLYLVFSHIILTFYIINCINSSVTTNNMRTTYLLFFILCNLQNSYASGIKNINKINPPLASSLHENLKNYFTEPNII